MFNICHFYFSFYVNDICFPPLIVTGENHSLTKKPPQRDDIEMSPGQVSDNEGD
jgi:hypothetical protein